MSKQFYFEQFSLVYYSFNVKIVLFQTIQLIINMQFTPIWPIDRTLSGGTTPEVQSVYLTVLADWAILRVECKAALFSDNSVLHKYAV